MNQYQSQTEILSSRKYFIIRSTDEHTQPEEANRPIVKYIVLLIHIVMKLIRGLTPVFKQGLWMVFLLLVRFADAFWRKDDKLVVVSEIGGDGLYSGNSRFLFEYLKKHENDGVRVVWLTTDRDLIREMSQKIEFIDSFQHFLSLEGIRIALRCSCCITSGTRLKPFKSNRKARCLRIMLWHGIPIKTIGRCEKRRSLKSLIEYRNIARSFDLWTVCSQEEAQKVSICTGMPKERIIVTGYPRNDMLVQTEDGLFDGNSKSENQKTILYAPTWRPPGELKWFPFTDFEPDELSAFLKKHNANLLIRGHYRNDILDEEADRTNVFFNENIKPADRDTYPDVQELLPKIDILISDYSGIFLDFLLTDRPMIFIPYDLDKYRDERGIMYDYDEITPGPKVNSFKEMLTALEDYLNDPEKDSELRIVVKHRFHDVIDGKSCQRIMEIIDNRA